MTVEYHVLPIDEIVIGERFRSGTGDLTDLKDSIETHGLLHPIVITRDKLLLAGFRRLTATRELGSTTIACRFFDECDDVTAREIELEENLARENLTWLDEDRLRAEIDKLKRAKYGSHYAGMGGQGNTGTSDGWDSKDTAESLGVSESTISRSVARMEAMEFVPSMADAPTRRAADRELDRFIQEIETELNMRRRKTEARALDEHILLGDCTALLSRMPNDSVDCIITDPPYGVDIKATTHDGGHRTPSGYEDDPVAIQALLRTAFKEMRRVLKHSGHAYIFCSSQPRDQITFIQLLENSGFDVDPIPLIWKKDSHSTVDWDYRFAPSYESILFCSNRQRRLADKTENVFDYPNDPDRIHTAQKPVALLSKFIELSTGPSEVVLDPFMGSGSTCIAAIRTGRKYIGMEVLQKMHDAAKIRIMNEVSARSAGDDCTCTHSKSSHTDTGCTVEQCGCPFYVNSSTTEDTDDEYTDLSEEEMV